MTFLSWMANARTSSFIARALVGIRNGLTLRSVGSNGMFHLVLFFKAGVACCLPTCAQGSSVPVSRNLGFGGFWTFMFHFSALCLLGGCVFFPYSQLCTRFGSLWCASCWTRPLGVLQWEHYLCDLWRANMAAHNTGCCAIRCGCVR